MWVSNPTEELWTGSEENIRAAQTLADRINAIEPQAFMEADAAEAPSLLTKEGNVGVIRIEGQLFAAVPDFIKAIFGVADYGDISKALVEAAKDPSIGSILLDVDSPGGAVSGIDTVASLVKRIDREIKPVLAHTDGTMASAAYWLSAGARSISAGDLAHVGSIGVLQIHREMSKMEQQDGITTTVLRAGRFKALGNPYEPLSDAARAEMQDKLDYTYKKFMGHVADSRGLPYDTANSKMGEGRVFIGEMAHAAGLVDSVATYEQALTAAQEAAVKSVDARKSLIQNHKSKEGANPMRKKAVLTDADIAAIASGAPIAVAPAAEEPKAVEPETPVAEAAPAEEPAAETQATEAAPAAAAPAQPDQSAVVALLEKQLKDAQEAVLAARVEQAKATDKLAELTEKQTPLVAIARDSVKKMHVALGGSGEHVEALEVSALLEEHTKISQTFKDRFKVGGVAAASAQVEDDGRKAPELSPAAKAKLRAVRLA